MNIIEKSVSENIFEVKMNLHGNNNGIDKENILLSVVIPAFREEKIIENTLKIFTPEFKKKYDLELIVSDGGSEDKTLEIAGKYADIIVRHEKETKQTISEGRNMGANQARGGVLVFLNADTVPADAEYFFGRIYDWAASNGLYSGAGALACKVGVSPDEKLYRDAIFYALHNNYVRLLNFIGIGMGRGECQIVKKEIFSLAGAYNEKLAAGEDFDLYRRIAKCAKIKYCNELLVYESPRRFRKYGYLKTLWQWAHNAVSVMVSGKSSSDEWEAVR